MRHGIIAQARHACATYDPEKKQGDPPGRPYRKTAKPKTENPKPKTVFYAGWLMADSFQGLLPTGRVKVQYSSNFTGSVLLPSTTWPVVSSTL